MLLIFVTLLVVFIPEAFLCFSHIRVLRWKKRITLNVLTGRSSHKKLIDIKQADSDKKYIITPDSESFLQVKDKKIYICNPYPEPLVQGFPAKTYDIGNGTSVSVKKKKPAFLVTIITCILVIMAIFVFKYFARSMVAPFLDASNHVELTHDFAYNIDFEKWDGITNYLIVGSDAREGLSTSRTDVMVVISFNENTKKMKICSLLRDLRVSIQDKTIVTVDQLDNTLPNYEALKNSTPLTQFFQAKLNYAVNIPYLFNEEDQNDDLYVRGLNTLVNTIEYNFKMPINGIISVTWEDFIKIIDTLGGIDLEITEQMLITDYDEEHAYGITPVILNQNALYDKDDIFSEAGIQHLNGNQALAFVRLRYLRNGANSDIERTERIRYFITELLKQKKFKLFTFTDSKTVSTVSENVYSSLSQDELYNLIDIICSIPTPENCGSLPHDFNEKVIINGAEYITVDGIRQDKLSEQAEEILCN